MFIVWPHVATVVVWFLLEVVALRMVWCHGRLKAGIQWLWTAALLMFPFVGALGAIVSALSWRRRAPVQDFITETSFAWGELRGPKDLA
ncbi:hypothetical protein [Curtobacterium sp. MCBD17_040]|uniref:hypothetical protein n=1 Tax=Curtobacterium sp. MCBD17_040 TaxID=2175674 RepID=UPI000DA957B6|nr:hypothetical protein [Curtobacterium sp. MCBD17_040]WIB65935.1 hypothetical protein DEI94_17630 [Curtobacterium sp. MCBD17_040]